MAALDALLDLLSGRRIAVLAGAGCSTDSGIPDYRGPETRHVPRRPIQHQQFVREPEMRRRYWARSLRGWPRIEAARPNAVHAALARLEDAGRVVGLVTQNVDALHHKAGSRAVIELHGSLSRVVCLGCGRRSPRAWLQERLLALNPGALERGDALLPEAEVAPDGDAMLAEEALADFRVADCPACGGVLMPDVVFFGGTVPGDRVQAAYDLVARADALLVVGSSLTVFSGYRFVRAAARDGQPVAIVNLGETRGDPLATVKLDAPLAQVLPPLVDALLDGE